MPKLTEMATSALEGPTTAFFAVGDNQNLRRETTARPLTVEQLREELHFYLLFAKHLTLVADDLIMNERLSSILLDPSYSHLLSAGDFIPLLRSQYDSIADVIQYLRKPDLYNPVPQEVLERLLHQFSKQDLYIARFDEAQAYENFTTVARHYLLDPHFMSKYELDGLIPHLSGRVDQLAREANRASWRRSLLFFYAHELDRSKRRKEARLIRHLSTLFYMGQFSGLFKQLPAFPSWYGRYLGDATGVVAGSGSRAARLATVSLEHLSPKIKPEVGRLTIREVMEIRRSQEFQRYIDAVETYDREGEVGGGIEHGFLSALETYLRFLDRRVGEITSGRLAARKRKTTVLHIERISTPTGVIVSVIDSLVAMTTGIPTSVVISPALNALTIAFYLYGRRTERQLEEFDEETARFWSAWCAPGGTFAAALTESQERIIRKVTRMKK